MRALRGYVTASEFHDWIEQARTRWDLVAPVTMDDLRAIKRALDQVKPVGIMTELVIRGSRVEITLGAGQPNPARGWLDIKGETREPGLAAMINARAAGVR